eukprot:6354336-Prymnesium_polylepis.1
MGKPFGEPVATSDRALRCSRLRAGAQRHGRAAFAALQPVELHRQQRHVPTVRTPRPTSPTNANQRQQLFFNPTTTHPPFPLPNTKF